MQSLSHIIIGAVFFGGQKERRAWAAAIGGLLPDVPLLVVAAYGKVSAIPAAAVSVYLSWQNWWQTTLAVSHNFWLWTGLLTTSIVLARRSLKSGANGNAWLAASALAASGLLHSVTDFLSQRQEGHMHFWPVTRWVFVSPVSSWDAGHFGTPFRLLEGLVVAAMMLYLFYQFQRFTIRVPLLLAIVAQIWVLVRFATG